MRLQTLYVDMRPAIVKWLGILLIFVFLVLLVASLRPDFMHAVARAREAYDQSTQGGGFSLGYWDSCLRSSACVKSFFVTWSSPLLVKALIAGGLIFGMLCAALGMLWRPEVVAMRDTRVNAARIEESRIKSPVAPKRLL